jgi:acyl carrier protein
MKKPDVRQRVYKIVSETLGVPLRKVEDKLTPDNTPAWDSLQHMNLISALEAEFRIRFEAEDITQMLSVGLIVETLRRRDKARA